MRRALTILIIVAVFAAVVAGEVIDRIVAVVNGRAILQSDCEEAMRYEAMLQGRPLDQLTSHDAKATLDRLIDQELLRQQMEGVHWASLTEEQIRQQLQDIRKQIPEASSDAGWQALLNRYGLTEEDIGQRAAQQARILQFIDMRLRPGVKIDAGSIETYYRETLVPELRRSGAKEAPLMEVSPRIEELLTQQKIDTQLASWLQSLREQSDIRSSAKPLDAGQEIHHP